MNTRPSPVTAGADLLREAASLATRIRDAERSDLPDDLGAVIKATAQDVVTAATRAHTKLHEIGETWAEARQPDQFRRVGVELASVAAGFQRTASRLETQAGELKGRAWAPPLRTPEDAARDREVREHLQREVDAGRLSVAEVQARVRADVQRQGWTPFAVAVVSDPASRWSDEQTTTAVRAALLERSGSKARVEALALASSRVTWLGSRLQQAAALLDGVESTSVVRV